MDERATPVFSDHGLAGPAGWYAPGTVSPLAAADAPEPLGRPLVPLKVASPRLSPDLFARLQSYGERQETRAGDVLFEPGDDDADMIVVGQGSVQVIRAATADAPAETVAKVGAGGFVGELNLLTGQNLYLAGRVREAGIIYRVSPDRLRQLMSNDGELSDIVFKALIARRELLRRSTAARGLEIVGHSVSAAALALRTYAARQRLIHLWFDASTPAGQAMMRSSGLTEDDLPAVVMSGTTLKRTTPGELAAKLNLSFHRSSSEPADVTIVGAGPAGLAAAVYGASEGLATVLLDAVGTGGQAAASSRIENYFGFPFGLSGADLTGRAVLQALKFGAQLASPCPAVQLDSDTAEAATCCACTCRATISSTARPSSSRPAPATGRCRWNAGPTSRGPASTTRPPSWRPAAARAARSPWSAESTRPDRPRSTWPGGAARSRWSFAARTSPPRCRPTWSTGSSPTPG